MKRGPSELQLSREYPEVQEENKKILQTIENALKQLNIVSEMNGQSEPSNHPICFFVTGKNSYERAVSQ